MNYPSAPQSFEEVMKLIPARGSQRSHRFVINGSRPFEICITRIESNVVCLTFGVPEEGVQYYRTVRNVECLTSQRQVWMHWEKFLAELDNYLT